MDVLMLFHVNVDGECEMQEVGNVLVLVNFYIKVYVDIDFDGLTLDDFDVAVRFISICS